MRVNGIQQVAGHHNLHALYSTGRGSDHRVIPSDMRVYDVEPAASENAPQSICREDIQGVQKGKVNIGIDCAAAPSSQDDFVTAPPQPVCQFEDMGFSAAAILRGVNLENAHHLLRNRPAAPRD